MTANTIGIIGAGAWGTALAQAAARRELDVRLWAREDEVAAGINEEHVNRAFLPGTRLSPRIRATTDLAEAAAWPVVLFVPPTQHLRAIAAQAAPYLPVDAVAVAACKGIEIDTLELPTRILAATLPDGPARPIAVLSGPTFAKEVADELPVDLVVASTNAGAAERIQRLLHAPLFRVYTSDDPVGVQVGGALKNVVAVAAGAADELGMGTNARAALITRGLAEITRAGVALGANPLTFLGLAGVGDLVLTCTGDLSRNRTFGRQLARGRRAAEIIAEERTAVEGYHTAKAAVGLADRHDIDMPISRSVYGVCYEGLSVADVARRLMMRERKSELTGIA